MAPKLTHRLAIRLNDEAAASLERLETELSMSTSDVIRLAIEELARQARRPSWRAQRKRGELGQAMAVLKSAGWLAR